MKQDIKESKKNQRNGAENTSYNQLYKLIRCYETETLLEALAGDRTFKKRTNKDKNVRENGLCLMEYSF